MRLAALFSGGKDSTYAVLGARRLGHSVECLVTVAPDTEESMLLHHPNVSITRVQASLMGIPHIYENARVDGEMRALGGAIRKAINEYRIEGIVHGGIRSVYQKARFGKVCEELGLGMVSPVWGIEPGTYMKMLAREGFRFIITTVSAGGLDGTWLGREVDAAGLRRLEKLASRFGFGLDFEGGEAETLVTCCPLFSREIRIVEASTTWDGYRGRFEIKETEPGGKAC